MQLGSFAAACAASVAGLALLAGETQARSERADRPHRAIEIETLSTKPWLVSGGDVLVEIRVPSGIRAKQVEVLLNGIDVSDAFRPVRRDTRPHPGQRVLRGPVSGLDLGSNNLVVTAEGHGGKDLGGTLELTNWPLSGPIISGPHEQPFFCQTEEFDVAGGVLGETLGPALTTTARSRPASTISTNRPTAP